MLRRSANLPAAPQAWRHGRILEDLAQAVLSGVAYGLSFPPNPIRWLAWFALVPLLLALRGSSWRRALVVGTVWTVVATWMVGNCLPGAVHSYYHQPVVLGHLLLLIVALATAVPYYGLFAVCYAALSRSFTTMLPVLAAAAWTASELGRIEGVMGDPWGVAGYSQASHLVLSQIADLTGVYGLSFIVATSNAALASLWCALIGDSSERAARPSPAAALAGCAMAMVAIAAVALYGTVRLGAAPASPALADPPPVAISIVQGNLDQGAQWRPQHYGRNLEAYLRLTMAALDGSPARIVFWPESAMTFFLENEPDYRRSIASALGPWNAELVAGGPRRAGAADAPTYRNSTFVVSPGGDVRAIYDKERLLPFAEYFPSSVLDFMRRDFGEVREFTPGTTTAPIATTAGDAGVIVCNEAMFPGPAAARVRDGASYLLNPSNDSWMGDVAFSLQVFDIVRLRAIEQRRTLVRASTSGPSAVIDPSGRVAAYADPMTRAWISGHVTPSTTVTPYARIGDAFAFACLLVTLASWLIAWRGVAGNA